MLLAKGKTIYFNDASKAVDYFAGIDFKCPELSNPSDFFMSIMSIETIEQERQEALAQSGEVVESKTVQEEYAERIAHFSLNYVRSNLFNNAERGRNSSVVGISAEMTAAINMQAASWCYQF